MEWSYEQERLDALGLYSYAGAKAKTADLKALNQAEELERRNVDPETIRQQTGWFRGKDGKWRFEIDDSGMQYHRSGDAVFSEMHPEYARHQELMQKWLYGEMTHQEEQEFRELDETWGREHQRLSDRVRRGNATLQNLIRHDALFEAYPELRGAKVVFADMEPGTRGRYDPQTNTITISEELKNAPQETLLHEIQHAIQEIEGFTGGASVDYWKEQRREITETIRAARVNLDLWLDDIGYKEHMAQSIRDVRDKKKTMEQHWKDMADFKANSRYARQIAACEAEIAEFQRQYDEITGGMTAYEQYENTAGEIEARDAAGRRNLTAEERKKTPPRLGDENTVFAEESRTSYSIVDVTGERGNYGNGVLLDTDIFDGIQQRKWGEILSRFVYKNLAGTELTLHDSSGRTETVFLAKDNDRVRKDGAKNSHKVLDKLAGYRGDQIRAQAIVHISEVLDVSEHETFTDEHSHQWMDENGWEIRKAYLQTMDGKIYEATLNIADGRNGKTLYEVNKVHMVDKTKTSASIPSTDESRRSRYQKPEIGGAQSEASGSLSNDNTSVKPQFSLSPAEDGQRREAEPVAAAQNPAEAPERVVQKRPYLSLTTTGFTGGHFISLIFEIPDYSKERKTCGS